VKCVDISKQEDLKDQKPLIMDCPDVVIATPSRALAHLKAGNLHMKEMEMLVIDEADVVLSFGYDDDVQELLT